MTIEVQYAGPILRGNTQRVTAAMCGDIDKETGELAVSMIQSRLNVVLQHPTGYYKSRVMFRSQGDRGIVTDSGVVYGPWLEGVSKRNSTTRFKGYATFRRVHQAIEARAGDIADDVVQRYVGDL